ncbi:MAG: ATP phosphoribosyltransferase [Acidobacteriota bacterium]|nr:MAG: ATP phosphoribosyltransferase [Acidobacteriota bacterium]
MKLNGENLKISIQKKGRLSQGSQELFKAAGLDFESSDGRLFSRCSNYPMDALYLRDDDIPEYVQDGVTDLGIVGLNVVEEKGNQVAKLDYLGFGTCELCIAVPKASGLTSAFDLSGKRIATSYPRITGAYLEKRGIDARVIEISGSVEITPSLDVADAICDIVSTGSTLRLHELMPIEVVLKSEAVLIANQESLRNPRKVALIERLRARILSHLEAKKTKYVMMNAPESALEQIRGILPGMKSPTIVPLAEEGMIAVHTAVPEDVFWDVIEALKAAGATDLLVVPVEKMVV